MSSSTCGRLFRAFTLACVLFPVAAHPAALGAQDVRPWAGTPHGAADAGGRLDEGRRLLDAGDYPGVRRLILPLAADPRPEIAGRAQSLLGTAAYWSGDFTRAARHFRAAIRLTPQDEAARRQLDEIGAASAAWVTVTGEARLDDQPLNGTGGGLEMGLYPTPLTTLGVRVRPRRLSSSAADLLVTSAELSAGGYVVPLRLEAELRGGFVRREPATTAQDALTTAIGALSVGLRLPYGVAVRGMLERTPYLWTEGSLATPLETDGASARVEWAPPNGWLGEAGGGVIRFPDDNIVVSTHLWVLAPLVRRSPVELRAGYAFALQDSRESRFVPEPAGGFPAAGSRTGRYDPYYTPEMVIAHSVVGALSIRGRSGPNFSVDGSVGVRASEMAPTPTAGLPGAGGRGFDFQQRTFRPWRARGVLGMPVSRGLGLELAAEHGASAFYESDVITLRLLYRRLPRPLATGG